MSKNEIFANLAGHVLFDENGLEGVKPDETFSAAKTLFAMALANGLITQPEEVIEFTEALTKQDEDKIVTYLQNYLEPVSLKLASLYSRYDKDENYIDAMSLAMETLQRYSGNNKNTAISEPIVLKAEFQHKKIKTLGCEFDDKHYLYKINKAFLNRKHEFATETLPMKFLEYPKSDQIVKFLADLQDMMASVMESTSYNDVDQLIR